MKLEICTGLVALLFFVISSIKRLRAKTDEDITTSRLLLFLGIITTFGAYAIYCINTYYRWTF